MSDVVCLWLKACLWRQSRNPHEFVSCLSDYELTYHSVVSNLKPKPDVDEGQKDETTDGSLSRNVNDVSSLARS